MVGTSISHYKIVSELGRGGMGIVYKAEDAKLNRKVAIKVLLAQQLASEDEKARFYREAQTAAALNSPRPPQTVVVRKTGCSFQRIIRAGATAMS